MPPVDSGFQFPHFFFEIRQQLILVNLACVGEVTDYHPLHDLLTEVQSEVEGFSIRVPIRKKVPSRFIPFAIECQLGRIEYVLQLIVGTGSNRQFKQRDINRVIEIGGICLHSEVCHVGAIWNFPDGAPESLYALFVKIFNSGPDDIHLGREMMQGRAT